MRLISDTTLDNITKPYVYISRFLLFLYIMIYIMIYIGVISYVPSYIRTLTTGFNIFICLFLIYKFNPFREHTLNKNDGKIIFASALFMLTNLGLTEIIKKTLLL